MEPLVEIRFTGRVVEWRGPAPFLFLAIGDDHVGEIRFAAQEASYGWGCVPVEAEIGGLCFRTSLFPRDGGYLLPLKLAVRRPLDIAPGDRLQAVLRIHAATGR